MECSALFNLIEDWEYLPKIEAKAFQVRYTEISKMLFGLIKKLST